MKRLVLVAGIVVLVVIVVVCVVRGRAGLTCEKGTHLVHKVGQWFCVSDTEQDHR